ncbi:hypothetical protein [Deinococcus sonorensis]|uniref:DUF3017 domain-containing protein n=2 Tax=Deinococcus sonorensis TaxID=309891 RepID=A0AAU7U9G2_9DEIO
MTRPDRPPPDRLTLLSLGLLAVLAVLLLLPLLGVARPPVWLFAALLLVRLGIQVLRARQDPRLRRPASWVLDIALIGLLLWVSQHPAGS